MTPMESLPLWMARRLPEVSGVYVITGFEFPEDAGHDNEVPRLILYVGKAYNICQRWKFHHRAIDLFRYHHLEIHWLPLPVDRLRDNERRLIQMFNPILNGKPILRRKAA